MDDLYATAKDVASELVAKAKLIKGKIVAVGCSTSEVLGDQIGTNSSKEVAYELFRGLKEVFDMYDIFIAAQCCEHLNRGIIIEQEACKSKYNLNGLWIGVVMDNAIDEVEAVAEYLCDTNDNDEVAKLFEEIL